MQGPNELVQQCMLIDQPLLRARFKHSNGKRRIPDSLQDKLSASIQRRQIREQNLPKPEYLQDLPVVQAREKLLETIAKHQVVIVCGETGSGKTTQLPKLCLELGRGTAGYIGHTQPRRLAARSLAARIAEELHDRVGGAVGFKIRFNDQISADSYIKVMTDGILLAETQSDPDLLAYDTLIVDEAHERSLNIDFILGYIKRLLRKRPELKIIITSATIDPERFSAHFDQAPIVEVSGRTYPVEIRYRPVRGDSEDEQDRDRDQSLVDAVNELARQGQGDILVFLPGERDIREAAEILRKHHPPETEILPLYGRLSFAQQNRIFQPHAGRRIVLATNVAETSLTVPGIHYVIDSGVARISRYSYRTKVQRLPIEPVSQASANQRTGRCGRVAPGICIRLYSEEDFLSRPEFTDPEILRTNLAAVILQMLVLKLGKVDEFPFIDAPDDRYIRDGFKLLHELGATTDQYSLTPMGYRMARLPVDVRLGRMILAAEQYQCLHEVLIIASALAIQDPRERPLENQQAADAKHAVFKHENSDFVSLLNLWRFYQQQTRHLSKNKLRKLCQQNFLSYVRMREWRETVKQLHGMVKEMQLKFYESEAGYAELHRALLTGLLSNIAQYDDKHEYTGVRGLKLYLFPGSGLFKKKPKWIVSAEQVETTRRYARTVARIEPEWVVPLADHLVKRAYQDPRWEKNRGYAVVDEQVSLYGLILVANRPVDYGKINPTRARELFIRDALVRGETHSNLALFRHNENAKKYVLDQENRYRRRDLLIDEQNLFEHFHQALPESIHTIKSFETWYKKQPKERQQVFYLDRQQLLQNAASLPTNDNYPVSLNIDGMELPLSYRFDPEHEEDGVTVTIPLPVLNQLDATEFEWLIPGLLLEKITVLIKSLPKGLRRNFVPVPEYAKKCMSGLSNKNTPLLDALSKELKRITGIEIPADAWRTDELPRHLLMNFNIVNDNRNRVVSGRHFAKLLKFVGKRATQSFTRLPTGDFERECITAWDFGDLPDQIEMQLQGLTVKGYPALVAENGQISLRLLDSAVKARLAHLGGTISLFKKQHNKSIQYLQKNLPDIQTLCLHYAPIGPCTELKQQLINRIVASALFDKTESIRNAADFTMHSDWADKQLVPVANLLCQQVGEILFCYHKLQKRLQEKQSPRWLNSLEDVTCQLGHLVNPRFVAQIPLHRMQDIPRYLKAVDYRLDSLDRNPKRDQELLHQLAPFWQNCLSILQHDDISLQESENFQHYRWLLEEYRVSLFAQKLGTRIKVSQKRLHEAWTRVNHSV